LWGIPFENTPDNLKQQVYDASGIVLSEESQNSDLLSLKKAPDLEMSLFGIPVNDFTVTFGKSRGLIFVFRMDMYMYPIIPEDAVTHQAVLEKMDLLYSRFSVNMERQIKRSSASMIFTTTGPRIELTTIFPNWRMVSLILKEHKRRSRPVMTFDPST
jgi:hypothetical protein